MTSTPGEGSAWYSAGLRFACRQCGACCKIEGYVWVGREAIRRIAGHLDLSVDEFGRKYLWRVDSRFALIEKPNRECIFWENSCAIYPVRPPQCKTFPFWSEQLASQEAWERGTKACHGMNQGRLYEIGEIRKIVAGKDATEDGREDDGPSGCGGHA